METRDGQPYFVYEHIAQVITCSASTFKHHKSLPREVVPGSQFGTCARPAFHLCLASAFKCAAGSCDERQTQHARACPSCAAIAALQTPCRAAIDRRARAPPCRACPPPALFVMLPFANEYVAFAGLALHPHTRQGVVPASVVGDGGAPGLGRHALPVHAHAVVPGRAVVQLRAELPPQPDLVPPDAAHQGARPYQAEGAQRGRACGMFSPTLSCLMPLTKACPYQRREHSRG